MNRIVTLALAVAHVDNESVSVGLLLGGALVLGGAYLGCLRPRGAT